MDDSLTLEKLKLHERLIEVEKQQSIFSAIQADCHSKISDLHQLLMGPSSLTNPNLLTRIDRMEQAEENRKIHRGIIYTAICGLLIEQIWFWMSHR